MSVMATDGQGWIVTKLLSLREVQKIVPVGLGTLRRYASQRRIPVVRIGRRVFVAESDLEKLVEARREPARPDVAV